MIIGDVFIQRLSECEVRFVITSRAAVAARILLDTGPGML